MRGEEVGGSSVQHPGRIYCWMSGRSEGYACHGLPPTETGSFGVYGYWWGCDIVGVCCV